MTAWIARDRDGGLHLSFEKPELRGIYWVPRVGMNTWIDKRLFPKCTYNGGPIEVELTIKEK